RELLAENSLYGVGNARRTAAMGKDRVSARRNDFRSEVPRQIERRIHRHAGEILIRAAVARDAGADAEGAATVGEFRNVRAKRLPLRRNVVRPVAGIGPRDTGDGDRTARLQTGGGFQGCRAHHTAPSSNMAASFSIVPVQPCSW